MTADWIVRAHSPTPARHAGLTTGDERQRTEGKAVVRSHQMPAVRTPTSPRNTASRSNLHSIMMMVSASFCMPASFSAAPAGLRRTAAAAGRPQRPRPSATVLCHLSRQPQDSARDETAAPITATRRMALAGALALASFVTSPWDKALADGYEPMEALKGKDYGKSRMRFEDFTLTPSGLQYKDMKPGTGETAEVGDKVTVDWDGYTIGYYGRPFEARNKTKGGAFTGDDKEYLRYTIGKDEVIPGFEEATKGMQVGGIRRIIVPVELGYPGNDMRKQGPKPSTFSGKRALGFVLENQGMIDKTLLFDIELLRVTKS